MAKPKISKVLDTLETLAEIPRRSAQEVAKTFNPLEALNSSNDTPAEHTAKIEKENDGNHTPLKLDKIKGQHEVNDLAKKEKTVEDQKLASLRSKLFNQVKGDESQAIQTKRKEDQEKKEIEMTEEQRKQEELRKRLAAHQNADMPQGKEKRGGLFAKKKKRSSQAVQENFPEMKGAGKH